jgi:hypothetical protein
MASGWTGSLISPNMRVHDAASAAIDHVGTQSRLAPSTSSNSAVLANQVLRDPTLGSRNTFGARVPVGAPVGSAAMSGGSIPPAVQAAISNLQTNSGISSLSSILNRVMGGTTAQPIGAMVSPQQNAYYQASANLASTQNQILNRPQQVADQIAALEAQKAKTAGTRGNTTVFDSSRQSGGMAATAFSPYNQPTYMSGGANPASIDAQLQNLYGQQADARSQKTFGWTSPNW